MDVSPQDLGKMNCERVLRHRAAFAPGVAEWAAPRITLSQNLLWLKLLGAFFLLTIFLSNGFLFYASLLFILVFAYVIVVEGNRRPQRIAARPRRRSEDRQCLTLPDVQRLREATDDPLQGKYLDLVQTALLLTPPNEASVGQTVRAAIHALGMATEGLTRHTSSLLTDNPGALSAEADRLIAQSRTETDAVIAASLERRAEAHARRAETVVRAQTLLRRNDALRDEMADQIDALRTSLIASGITQEIEDAGLAELATNVQRIATEVNALSAARAEVEDALHGAPTWQNDPATRVRLRKYQDETDTVVDTNVIRPGG